MNFALAQIGARKNYVTLRALAENNLLHEFFTDIYYGSAHSRMIAGLLRASRARGAYQAITGRKCDGVQIPSLREFPLFSLMNRLRTGRAKARGKQLNAFRVGGTAFAARVAKQGFEGASGVYAFSSAALEAFEKAKQSEMYCVLDHETPPAMLEYEHVNRCAASFQEWLPDHWTVRPVGLDAYHERQLAESRIADLVICPSTHGRRLVVESGVPTDKTAVLPFAMDTRFVTSTSRPAGRTSKTLRVLFLGNDAIRKGLPDLVTALRLLGSASIEAKGGGAWTISQRGKEQCRNVIERLGSVPRSSVPNLYDWSDVFVMPTLSDTMAVVILEAMASGVPVIATETSGGPDLLREGLDGFIVPANAPERIAEKLELLASQPELLREMSENARQRAGEFDFECYRRALTETISTRYGSRESSATVCSRS